MEDGLIDQILSLGQTPALVVIAYLLFRLSQQFTIVLTKMELILNHVIKAEHTARDVESAIEQRSRRRDENDNQWQQ